MDCWRLLEVYNLSPMITEDQFENNNLSHYVKEVHTSLDEPSIYYEKDGFVFAYMNHGYTLGWWLVECKLKDAKIILPEGCQEQDYCIYDYAFYAYPEYTNLTCLIIPPSVIDIGDYAFFNNKKLIEIYNLSSISMRAGVNSDRNGQVARYAKVVHTSLDEPQITEIIGDYAFATIDGEKYLITYLGNEKSITLPRIDESYKIYTGAFSLSHIESVVIPNCVTEIGRGAFNSCYNLLSVTIPESVIKMEEAFYGSTSIAEIYNYSQVELLPNGEGTSYHYLHFTKVVHTAPEDSVIDRIGDFVFARVDNVNYLVAYLGDDCDVELPQSYKGEKYTVAQGSFLYRRIRSVTIPKNVACIEISAFYENIILENVYFEDTEGWYYISTGDKRVYLGSHLFETGKGGYEVVNNYAWYYKIYNE